MNDSEPSQRDSDATPSQGDASAPAVNVANGESRRRSEEEVTPPREGGAPVTNGTTAATPNNVGPKPSVCRNLFGRVDPEELSRTLARTRTEVEEGQRERWNFDFRNDRPLEGAYQWEKVDT